MNNITVLQHKTIDDFSDLLDVVRFNSFNELDCWNSNPVDAVNCIFSCLNGIAKRTVIKIDNYLDVPKRNDFPKWRHNGGHVSKARNFWNYFYHKHPDCELFMRDAPDFFGTIGDNIFYGDIGQVSVRSFAFSIKHLRKGDLWISVLDDGSRQIIIEPLADVPLLQM